MTPEEGTIQSPKPPEEPKALRPDVVDAIKKAAKDTVGDYMDERLDALYKKRDETMHQHWKSQMELYEEQLVNRERYRELAQGKNLIGAIAFHRCQRNSTAKTISDGLKEFTGNSSWEKTLNLEDQASGGALVQGEVVDFFFGPLRANSVVYSLNPVRRTMVNDQGTLTGFETDPAITWVGEVNTDQEVADEGTTGNRTYSAKKAMLATPVSNDMLGSTLSARIAAEIEEQMQFAFTIGFDIVLITGTGSQYRPKGIRNWALAANEVASAGATLANIFADFRDAFNAIESLNVPMRNMGIIMAPRSKNHMWLGALDADNKPALREEMQSGSVFGVPWRVTTTVPTNLGGGADESYIILADFSQIVVAEGPGLEIARSGEASWTEASVVQLPREQDVTVFWAKAKIDTVVPHPEAIYVITGVQYGA